MKKRNKRKIENTTWKDREGGEKLMLLLIKRQINSVEEKLEKKGDVDEEENNIFGITITLYTDRMCV